MEPTFGERLQAARKRAGYRTQAALADKIGRAPRTVRNWETDKTVPDTPDLAALRDALGDFDAEGDPVVVALSHSELIEWRRDAVRAEYKRHLHEQQREGVRAG